MKEKAEKKSYLEILAEESENGKFFSGEETPDISGQGGNQRKRIVFASVVLLIAFVAVISVSLVFQKENRRKNAEDAEEIKITDFDELARGRLSGNIRSAMNTAKGTNGFEPDRENSTGEKVKPSKNVDRRKSLKNKNEEKDREIIESYAKLSDAAEFGGTSKGIRRRFVPGGENAGGGVFVKKSAEKTKTKDVFALHDVKIKAKLDFSIRSTAQSTVVASVTEGIDGIPKGAKFYGTPRSFVNKRTQLYFSKLIIGSDEFSVKGFAVSGKDPGIESEVTDISGENIKSEVKQGLSKTAGAIVSKLAGSAGNIAGTAAGNTIGPASSEMEKQEEANKMKQEYRVPAGTSFFVYLE